MKSKIDYINRWNDATHRRRAVQLVNLISRGRFNPHALLKFTNLTQEERIDLRGLTFDKIITFRRKELLNLDFESSTFKYLELRKCKVESVSFKNISAGVWRDSASSYQSTDFSGAVLGSSAIGLDGSTYQDVDFTGADLRQASFYRPKFIRCDFSRARLRRVDFAASAFEEVVFEGDLTNVWFNHTYRFPGDEKRYGRTEPNSMYRVDFRNVRLYGVVFTGGLDLSTIILPKDGSLLLIHRFAEALERAAESLYILDWPQAAIESAQNLIRAYQVHAEEQPMWILSRYEVDQLLGGEYAPDFVDLIMESEGG